jgi:hypothetical protein
MALFLQIKVQFKLDDGAIAVQVLLELVINQGAGCLSKLGCAGIAV